MHERTTYSRSHILQINIYVCIYKLLHIQMLIIFRYIYTQTYVQTSDICWKQNLKFLCAQHVMDTIYIIYLSTFVHLFVEVYIDIIIYLYEHTYTFPYMHVHIDYIIHNYIQLDIQVCVHWFKHILKTET